MSVRFDYYYVHIFLLSVTFWRGLYALWSRRKPHATYVIVALWQNIYFNKHNMKYKTLSLNFGQCHINLSKF